MDVTFSIATYHAMRQAMEQNGRDLFSRPRISPRSVFGMPVHTFSAFPFVATCKACEGTGEGDDSTYCQKCNGAGENRYEGMVRNGPQTIMLTVKLPKKFAPYFPKGLVPPAPLSRGLA